MPGRLDAFTSPRRTSLSHVPQILPRPYSERDVADVESYVRETVGGISPCLASDERERLVARGMLLVQRIASALPPELSLAAVLEERLAGALAVYRWRAVRLSARPAAQLATRQAA
jgi:hypothetical protein